MIPAAIHAPTIGKLGEPLSACVSVKAMTLPTMVSVALPRGINRRVFLSPTAERLPFLVLGKRSVLRAFPLYITQHPTLSCWCTAMNRRWKIGDSDRTVAYSPECAEWLFSEVPHSPGPMWQGFLCRLSEVRNSTYIRGR